MNRKMNDNGTYDCDNYNCPVETTLKMIGGKYKALILWHLLDGTLRFGQLSRMIHRAAPKVLTGQLRELEEANLIIRTVYPVVPPKVEYKLSETGKSIRPILEAMFTWGSDYLEQNGKTADCPMVPDNQ